MRLEPFEYERPASLQELAHLCQGRPEGDCLFLAGGTDLLVKARQRLAQPRTLISLHGLPELRGIRQHEETIRIGAATPLREMAQSPLVRRYLPALATAAGSVASPQIRNMGTLGGNVCLDTRCLYYNQPDWQGAFPACFKRGGGRCHVVRRGSRCYALFSADTPAALLALGAILHLAGQDGEREVPVQEFYQDDGCHPRRMLPGEVLVEVILPAQPEMVSVYRRFSLRQAIDFPLLGVAASKPRHGAAPFSSLRLAVTGLASQPVRLQRLEELLSNEYTAAGDLAPLLESGLRDIKPVRHQGISASYRKHVLGVLLEEALAACAAEGGKAV